MYIGHIGVALALRAHRDAPPLWLLILAAQGPDWIELTLESIGRAWRNPATSPHALPWIALGAVCSAIVATMLAVRARRAIAPAAVVAAVAYLSHWAADYITGIKPTWPGGPMVGLGLYGRPGLDMLVEAVVVGIGWWVWRRALPPHGRTAIGTALAVALLGALLALQFAADVVMSNGGWIS